MMRDSCMFSVKQGKCRGSWLFGKDKFDEQRLLLECERMDRSMDGWFIINCWYTKYGGFHTSGNAE